MLTKTIQQWMRKDNQGRTHSEPFLNARSLVLISSHYQLVIDKPISGCVRMACDSLLTTKSVASCQQTCCKLIVKTCYPQACFKLFQRVAASVQMTSCNKPDFNWLVAVSWNRKKLL